MSCESVELARATLAIDRNPLRRDALGGALARLVIGPIGDVARGRVRVVSVHRGLDLDFPGRACAARGSVRNPTRTAVARAIVGSVRGARPRAALDTSRHGSGGDGAIGGAAG